jgi:hypothetical protein
MCKPKVGYLIFGYGNTDYLTEINQQATSLIINNICVAHSKLYYESLK